MTEPAPPPEPVAAAGDRGWWPPTPAGWRLLALALVVSAVPVALALTGVVHLGGLRREVASTGPLAPAVYVLVSAVLGAALVPGPLLAGLSGALFGPVTGTVVTVCSAVLSAEVSWWLGRRAGERGASELLDPRWPRRAELTRRHGTAAVVVQRLAPGVPDAPLSYAFGALGLSAWQVALGTAVGALPRAFSYTAIGASVDDPGSPLALAGWAGVVVSCVVGAEVLRRATRDARRGRRREQVSPSPDRPTPPTPDPSR